MRLWKRNILHQRQFIHADFKTLKMPTTLKRMYVATLGEGSVERWSLQFQRPWSSCFLEGNVCHISFPL